MTTALNGDLSRRVAIDTAAMQWQASPAGQVWRKRLHRVGPAEAGQVTSVVRYEPGSTFPAHDHPDGEEILVIDGRFCDEHGAWGRGSHLLHPQGYSHAPYSPEGCLLFVKLRQYAGADRLKQRIDTQQIEWQPGSQPGIEQRPLYAQDGYVDRVRLERWARGASAALSYPDGVELFVLEGAFADAEGRYGQFGWLRLPFGAGHTLRCEQAGRLYVKTGGLRTLRSG